MPTTTPNFLTFTEAVAAATQEPGVDFIGLRFDSPFRHLTTYVVSVDPDEPDYVNVAYNGGDMFSYCGEEDFYGKEDAPAEAKVLFYARQSELGNGDPQIMGMTSEYALFELLPGLRAPDTYEDEAEFNQEAGQIFKGFWRQA